MSNFVAISVAEHVAELDKVSDAAARLHEAHLGDVAARLEEKCKEVELLEEKLHNLKNIEGGVNDDDDSPSSRNEDGENVELVSEGLYVVAPLTCIAEEGGSTRRVRGKKTTKGLSASIHGSLDSGSSPTVSAFRNKCKEVERLQGRMPDAYAAFDAQDERTVRTRTSKAKRATKSLSQKIKELATILKEKIAEHQHCIEEMRLERKELEETQQQKTL